MGGLGLHALELSVAAAQFDDEAFDSFSVHLEDLWAAAYLFVFVADEASTLGDS